MITIPIMITVIRLGKVHINFHYTLEVPVSEPSTAVTVAAFLRLSCFLRNQNDVTVDTERQAQESSRHRFHYIDFLCHDRGGGLHSRSGLAYSSSAGPSCDSDAVPAPPPRSGGCSVTVTGVGLQPQSGSCLLLSCVP